MVKFKKVLALSCAATMVFSSTAFADGTVSQEISGGGSSVVENDNSTAPRIDKLVLPTMGDNTYDFTIDPDELLAKYDPVGYASGQSVYFNATMTPATLGFALSADTSTYGLYVQKKVVDTGLTKLSAALVAGPTTKVALLDGTADTILANYFVWVPDTDNEGNGKFIPLTSDNVEKVLDITYSGSVGAEEFASATLNVSGKDNLAGDFIWDGKVYTVGYENIEPQAAVEYYQPAVADPSTPEGVKAGLFVGTIAKVSTGDYSDIAPATLGSATKTLKYTEPVMQQTGITDKATIVNKSTFDIGVIAEVTVNDATGLTFLASDTIASEDATASVYMALTDGTNDAVVANGKATAYYVVKGTGDDALTYQVQATTGTEAGTGSHLYKQYLTATQTYDDVEFQIEAKANTNGVAKEAWETYVETLTKAEGAQTKPSIDVVFKFVEIEDAEATSVVDDKGTEATGDDETTYFATFTGKDASVFAISAASESAATTKLTTGGWATYEAGEKAPSIANTTVTYSKSAGAVVDVDLGVGNLKATGVASAKFGLDAESATYDMTYSYDAQTGKLTLNSGFMGGAGTGDARVVKVTFNDTAQTAVILNVTIAD